MSTFETQTCGRCGGTGNYSYCQMYGTTCFGCSGAKIVYTKRGQEAKRFFEASCSKFASEFKVGEVIKFDCYGQKSTFATITEIGTIDDGNKWMKDGVWMDYFVIKTNKGDIHTFPNSVYRQGHSNEDKAAKIALALEYQASLTKAGKPMKRQKASV